MIRMLLLVGMLATAANAQVAARPDSTDAPGPLGLELGVSSKSDEEIVAAVLARGDRTVAGLKAWHAALAAPDTSAPDTSAPDTSVAETDTVIYDYATGIVTISFKGNYWSANFERTATWVVFMPGRYGWSDATRQRFFKEFFKNEKSLK